MSRTRKKANRRGGRDRHISVRSIRRTPPDPQMMSRAIMEIALHEAAAEKAAQDDVEQRKPEQPHA